MKRKLAFSLLVSTVAFLLLTGMFNTGATLTNAPYGCNYTTQQVALDSETGEEIEVSSHELRGMPHHVVSEKSSSGDFYVVTQRLWKCTFYYMDDEGRYQSHILSEELVDATSEYNFDELVDVYRSCNSDQTHSTEESAPKPVLTVSGLDQGRVKIEGASCLGLDWYGHYDPESSSDSKQEKRDTERN